MTMIRLDPAAADQLRTAAGPVVFCDEFGRPVRAVLMPDRDPIDREPDLPAEEWHRRATEGKGHSTAEVLDILRRLGGRP